MVQVPEKQIGQSGVENPVGIGEGQPPVLDQAPKVEGGQVMPAPIRPVEVDPPKTVPNTGEVAQPIPPDGANAQLAKDMAAPVVPPAPKPQGDPYANALTDDAEALEEVERGRVNAQG